MPESNSKYTKLIIRRAVLATVGLGILFWALVHFDVKEHVQALFSWLEDLGAWAPVIFMAIYTLVVILVLPGFIFTLGAGFLFGVFQGFFRSGPFYPSIPPARGYDPPPLGSLILLHRTGTPSKSKQRAGLARLLSCEFLR